MEILEIEVNDDVIEILFRLETEIVIAGDSDTVMTSNTHAGVHQVLHWIWILGHTWRRKIVVVSVYPPNDLENVLDHVGGGLLLGQCPVVALTRGGEGEPGAADVHHDPRARRVDVGDGIVWSHRTVKFA